MSLYQVTFDGDHDYIEAASFGDAITIWNAEMQRQGEFEEDAEEPESVTLITDKPVLRAAPVPA